MQARPGWDSFGGVDPSAASSDQSQDTAAGSKARRRADLALVGSYYEASLAELLERVREGFGDYDAGRLDAFELDDLIHRYKRATRELWKFCGSVTGSSAHSVARALEAMHERSETIDWWEQATPRGDRR